MRKDIRDDDNNINNLIKDKNEDKINIELNEKRKASEQEYQTLRNKIIYLNSRTLQLEKDAEERRKALKENEEKILHKQDLIMTDITRLQKEHDKLSDLNAQLQDALKKRTTNIKDDEFIKKFLDEWQKRQESSSKKKEEDEQKAQQLNKKLNEMQEKINKLEIENNSLLDKINKKKAASNNENFVINEVSNFKINADKNNARKAYIHDKWQFLGNMKPNIEEIKNSTYTREQKYGKDTLTGEIIFLDKNGKQINDVEIIRQNYDKFGSVKLYKQNESNKDSYECFNEGKDFENNCKIFLAHRNPEFEIK